MRWQIFVGPNKRTLISKHVRSFLLLVILSRATVFAAEFPTVDDKVFASLGGQAIKMAVDRIAFEDLDGDGELELITHEESETYPKSILTTISNWKGAERVIEWQLGDFSSPSYFPVAYFMVGNVTGNPLSEVILFAWYSHRNKGFIQVLGWNGSTYEIVAKSTDIRGYMADLIDIDGNGTQEIVLAYHQPDDGTRQDAEGGRPSALSISRVEGSRFQELHTLVIDHEVRQIATGDLDGDGLQEIVTFERSYDLLVQSQISIHTVHPTDGISRRDAFNEFLPNNHRRRLVKFWFMSIFQCGNQNYLYMDSGLQNWKSVFRYVQNSNGDWSLEPLGGREYHLYYHAYKSAMVHSHDAAAFVRRTNDYKYETIPDRELASTYVDQACK